MNSDHSSRRAEPETIRESGRNDSNPKAGLKDNFSRFCSVTFQLYRVAAAVAWRIRYRSLAAVVVLVAVEVVVIRFADAFVMRWLASWQTIQVAKLADWLSFLGQFQMVPLALLAGIWIWCEVSGRRDGRIALGAAAIAMAVGGITVQLPKFVFGRPRPHFNLPDQFAWFHPEWNSFPSGHATHWFALAGALGAFAPRVSYFVVPLAVIASLSRVLARAHYPSDSIAGAAFGLFLGLCFGLAARSINTDLGRLPRH